MPAPSPFSNPRFHTWSLVVLVTGLVLFCYWPAMHGVMLWDDPAHVTRPDLRGWDGLWRMWTDLRATQQYYPVLSSVFWVEHRLWGDSMFGYHLLNALLHAANSCLLGAVVHRLCVGRAGGDARAARWAAWTAALLFAVHPIAVESVAWITEQKNTLSTCLYLLAGLAWLNFDETRRWRWYAVATGLFVLALGAKSVVATLPAALLVVVWWIKGRIEWRRDVVPIVPWLVVGLGAGLLTAWVERTYVGAEGGDFELTLVQRGLLASRVVWFYASKVLWPSDLAFFYPRWDVAGSAAGWGVAFAAALVVTGVLWSVRRRARGPLAAWLLYVGALFPALGFFNVFPFQFSYVADHFQYLALVCAAAATGCGLATLAPRMSATVRRAAMAGTLIVVTCLALHARGQSALYQHNELLFRDNIAKVPDSWMAHQILAHTLAKDPARSAEAIAIYREAIRLKPDHPEAHLGLAVELAKSPATRAEAIALYERAIKLRPHYAEAHNNLGFVLAGLRGREADAERHLRKAARLNARFLAPRLNLANLLARTPARRTEAIVAFGEVVRLQPDHAGAHHSLGVLLIQSPDRRDEALAHFEAAVRIEPANVDALNSLAIASAELGRLERARECWQRALEIEPGFEAARENLRRLESMQGR